MTAEEAARKLNLVVEQTVRDVNRQALRRCTMVKNTLRNAELEVLRGHRSGKKYRVPGASRRYTASAPGEPPARRTGALRTQWIGGIESGSSEGGMSVTVFFESDTPYAGYLENGTSKMAARPFVNRIAEKAMPEIVQIMSENFV